MKASAMKKVAVKEVKKHEQRMHGAGRHRHRDRIER